LCLLGAVVGGEVQSIHLSDYNSTQQTQTVHSERWLEQGGTHLAGLGLG
jgi:hypothetical protein